MPVVALETIFAKRKLLPHIFVHILSCQEKKYNALKMATPPRHIGVKTYRDMIAQSEKLVSKLCAIENRDELSMYVPSKR